MNKGYQASANAEGRSTHPVTASRSTQHQPATPLPWTVLTATGELADHAYIVHAANAYPELIGTIQHYLDRFKDDEALLRKEQREAITSMRRLLRSLGEA